MAARIFGGFLKDINQFFNEVNGKTREEKLLGKISSPVQ
jgi:hypothetical protein